MYDLRLPPHLEHWAPRIERRIALTLAPIEVLLDRLVVRLETIGEAGSRAERAAMHFVCELEALAQGGARHCISVAHSDGHTAVQDALARLRRELVRAQRLAPLR
jgi:hypothetical protein